MFECGLAFCVPSDSEPMVCILTTIKSCLPLYTPQHDLVRLRKEVLDRASVGTTHGTIFGAISSH